MLTKSFPKTAPTVRQSAEVNWLVGTLERNGQRGLLPENYVKFI